MHLTPANFHLPHVALMCTALVVSSFSLAPLLALINNILEIRVDGKKMVRDLKTPLLLLSKGKRHSRLVLIMACQLTLFLRAPAERANTIGIWNNVIGFIATLSVITNDFVDRRVYASRNGGSMNGYILSIYSPSPLENSDSPNLEDCYYAGVYDENGERNTLYWEIWFAKAAFFIIFEHSVFLVKYIVQAAYHKVPRSMLLVCVLIGVRIAKKREAFLARAIMEGLEPDHYTKSCLLFICLAHSMFFVRQAQEHEVQDVEQNTEAAASKQEQFSTVDENSLAGDQADINSEPYYPSLGNSQSKGGPYYQESTA
ncbi:uncharacterized protein MONBRDRAFT_12740 [Monosiga brevicollis MX1]|uniref:Anoctamin transmembrane domain-containing protein n=1 Tax=Monosiga brevicollis TaxID=81824 RepID=A9VD65_MONBE|nr:uncharacterized protein MONBRDRAFT_12740 [Monosiga brevicollis MX1]EDQ84475.1 predicted protein [Monosiga brevicollis MX1]|eukprot:XP_001750662.1 hypothetical protein [Monosiga brevicollis MX1]